jgi:putative mycofactocin binding protein MftB
MSVVLKSVLEIHPQVAVRPETFGALAYHYGNRRLIFLKHPDVVTVVQALNDHPDVQSTLNACGVTQDRWPSFIAALSLLETSEVVRERQIAS